MDSYLLALHFAVFAAALLQAATGIGFGIIAGPIILIVMNSGSAIQVSILLNLLIALVLAPRLYGLADKALLVRLLWGTLAGMPLGIIIFTQIDIDMLKLLAGVAVMFMALIIMGVLKFKRQGAAPSEERVPADGRVPDLLVGVVSGAMCSSLAMPGPVVAARMMALDAAKETVRATVLVMFVFSYFAALATQALMVGISTGSLTLSASLAPATLVGVFVGRYSVAWISQRGFRWILSIILTITALGLLWSVV
jgi:uncharacterized membrane protein YfcA